MRRPPTLSPAALVRGSSLAALAGGSLLAALAAAGPAAADTQGLAALTTGPDLGPTAVLAVASVLMMAAGAVTMVRRRGAKNRR